MGSYFHTAISTGKDNAKTFNFFASWHKFLESYWVDNAEINYIYRYIKNESGTDGLLVATVCDYDKYCDGFIYSQNKQSVQLDKKVRDDLVKTGIFINDDTQTYFDLATFWQASDDCFKKGGRTNIVSPLHLLTRKSNECMGGGDLDFDKFANKARFLELVGSWYGKRVRYQDDTTGLDTYQDISYFILIEAE